MKKKQLILILLIGFCFFLKAQELTVREVYNFAVGDTFHYENLSNAGYFKNIKIILERQDSRDTIFYKIRLIHKTLRDSLVSDIETTEFFINPDSSAYQGEYSKVYSSGIRNRKSYSNGLYNRRLTNSLKYHRGDYEFDLIMTKGIGTVHFYAHTYWDNYFLSSNDLIYYHKGSEIWDINYPVTATNEPSLLKLKLDLFPNPVSDILNIKTTEPVNEIKILSLEGKVVSYYQEILGTEHSIMLHNLQNSLYFVQVYHNKSLFGMGKFMVNK